jgi:hypothetical protein
MVEWRLEASFASSISDQQHPFADLENPCALRIFNIIAFMHSVEANLFSNDSYR